jgi:hypothetical protein
MTLLPLAERRRESCLSESPGGNGSCRQSGCSCLEEDRRRLTC